MSLKDVLLIIVDWNAKVESQEIAGVTGKFGLGVQNEAVGPKQKQCSIVDVPGGESKVRCCKE